MSLEKPASRRLAKEKPAEMYSPVSCAVNLEDVIEVVKQTART